MKTLFCAAVGLGAALALPAAGATLDATSLIPSVSGFSIDFNDSNGDGLFELGELVSFTGVTLTGFGGGTYDIVSVVPTIAGFTLPGALPGSFPLSPEHWSFSTAAALPFGFSGWAPNWTYQITGLPSQVPLPATLPLLALAVVPFAQRRRRA